MKRHIELTTATLHTIRESLLALKLRYDQSTDRAVNGGEPKSAVRYHQECLSRVCVALMEFELAVASEDV